MRSNIWTIMKKEFSRFFGDRRMLIMLILPGVLIYAVYSFMGTALQNMLAPDTEYARAYVVNMPDSLSGEVMGDWAWAQLLQVGADDAPDVNAAKEKVASREADLCVIFPPDFDRQVEDYDVRTSAGPAPNIEIYYNSSDMNSINSYGIITAMLGEYESSLSNKFDINRDAAFDLATEEDASANIISSLMPLLMMVFLYSGCIAIAPESIAGEKERGTIGALLVSPLKRSQLAVGKILSLGVLAFLAGLISAVAAILSLPKLMGGTDSGLNVNIYGAGDYVFLVLIILSTILLLVSLISIISAFSKTVKEANAAVVPLMIVVMLVGVTGMFGGGAQTGPGYYIIPLYNSVQSMSGVFSLNYSAMNVALAAVSNIIYACIGGFILTKMFNSEKIMFSR